MVDMFPNTLNMSVTESAADTFTTTVVNTPRRSLAQGNVVMEICWVDMFYNTVFNAAAEALVIQISQGGVPTAPLAFGDPNLLCEVRLESQGVSTAITTAPIRCEMQTTDGFGVLFAGEQLHFSVAGTGTGIANAVSAKLFYRDVKVTTTELNGLIISLLQ